MALIDFEKIKTAQKNICETVLNQIENGEQSKEFKTNALACGQFLKVPKKTQHGYHGTTAAIRVLAGNPEKYKDKINKLLNYFDLEKKEKSKSKTNIIKNAELLYALSFIQAGTANTEGLKQKIYSKLKDSRNQDGGWAFFTDYQDDSDIYSTSLVFLALKKQHYNNLDGTISFLTDRIKDYNNNKFSDPTDFAKACFMLYVFVELGYNDKQVYKELINKLSKKIWKSEYCIMDSEYEQNIEYPGKEKHYYVRIPWQLYLISATNVLIPRYFAKKTVINKINNIITAINEGNGFVYKQSGKNISTRTYSIIYEFLENLKNKFKPSYKYKLYNIIDSIRIFIGKKWIRNIISIIGAIVIVFLMYFWIQGDNFEISSIAPSIIASLLIIITTLGKSK